MKVRPIFWYMLTLTLALAFGLGTWGHVQAARQWPTERALSYEQEYPLAAEKTDTALFLEQLAEQAALLQTELTLYTTESASGDGGYSCQITAAGAYNDLAQLLIWLQEQSCVGKIQHFDLSGTGESRLLVVEAVLW